MFPGCNDEFLKLNSTIGLPPKKPVAAILTQKNPINETDPRTKGAGKTAKLECPARNAALEPPQTEASNPGRLHIRFESVRKRLLDPDNISEKWLLDALRFSGTIQGDEPDKITLETTQRKVQKGEEEHTVIQIFEL